MTNWYSDEHATLGDRLAVAREHNGLSQSGLASKLGVRVKTIRDWENDLSEPRANRLQMLAAVLGVSLRWLLTGQGDDIAPPTDDETTQNGDINAVISEIRTIRGDMTRMGERLARLEKTLRRANGGPQA